MRKSTKGAVAASAAALLLIGGWGTKASWSDDGTVTGSSLDTGHLKLVGAKCDGWLIGVDLSDEHPVELKLGDLLSPGNVLTQVCTFKVDAVGVNLEANLKVSSPQLSGDSGLTGALTIAANYTRKNGAAPAVAIEPESTPLSDGDVVTATIRVVLPHTVDNLTQDLTAALQDITVTAQQV